MFAGIERKNILKNIPLKNVGEHFFYYSIVLSKNINKLFLKKWREGRRGQVVEYFLLGINKPMSKLSIE